MLTLVVAERSHGIDVADKLKREGGAVAPLEVLDAERWAPVGVVLMGDFVRGFPASAACWPNPSASAPSPCASNASGEPEPLDDAVMVLETWLVSVVDG
ncbi:hypothetical protein [Planctomycetes bacterium Pan216]|uniref:hypothetical protein n=1 Tax=Kolteria novifilia TaxID=2527975 RepID=UPI0011A95CE4